MTKIVEVIIPVILTGLGVIVLGLFNKVDDISKTIHENKQYVIMLHDLKERVKDHEDRIRDLTRNNCNNVTGTHDK